MPARMAKATAPKRAGCLAISIVTPEALALEIRLSGLEGYTGSFTDLRVEKPAEIGPALQQALKADRPVVLDVVTDIDALAPVAVSE